MSIDKETVKHISKLAKISLEDKKIESLSKDLTSIMKFIEKLNKLNTDKIVPLTSIIDASLKSRKDEVKDGKIRDQVLKNSPEKNDEFFVNNTSGPYNRKAYFPIERQKKPFLRSGDWNRHDINVHRILKGIEEYLFFNGKQFKSNSKVIQ